MTMAHLMMRCLLSLVLGLGSVLPAQAGAWQGELAPSAPVASTGGAPCHEQASRDMAEQAKAASGIPAPHDDCKAGECACACAGPLAAPLAAVVVLPPEAAAQGLPALLDYSSHILPLLLRPPIA